MADRGRLHRDENPQSIPVGELLAAHKRIRRIEQEPQGSLDALLRREQPQPPVQRTEPILVSRNRSRHAPILLGLASAAAVLAGALVATQAVTKQDEPSISHAAAPESITGAKVFRPDVIRASLNTNDVPAAEGAEIGSETTSAAPADAAGEVAAGGVSAGGPQRPAGQQPQQDGGVAPKSSAKPPAAGAPAPTSQAQQPKPSTTTKPTAPAATTTRSNSGGLLDPILEPLDPVVEPILGPILGFYSAAPSQPAAAYQMLAPSVQEGTVEDFRRSWDGVTEAKVQEARPAGTDAVIVRVSLLRADGTRLVTQQRIVVSRGSTPKITDAQLLSVRLG